MWSQLYNAWIYTLTWWLSLCNPKIDRYSFPPIQSCLSKFPPPCVGIINIHFRKPSACHWHSTVSQSAKKVTVVNYLIWIILNIIEQSKHTSSATVCFEFWYKRISFRSSERFELLLKKTKSVSGFLIHILFSCCANAKEPTCLLGLAALAVLHSVSMFPLQFSWLVHFIICSLLSFWKTRAD